MPAIAEWISWAKLIGGVVGGFVVGRLGTIVDQEIRQSNHVRVTLPALVASQDATNRALDVMGKQLASLAESELQLRRDLQRHREESNESLKDLGERVERLDCRMQHMGWGNKECAAGHWVPPLDRAGFAGPTIAPPTSDDHGTDPGAAAEPGGPPA